MLGFWGSNCRRGEGMNEKGAIYMWLYMFSNCRRKGQQFQFFFLYGMVAKLICIAYFI